MKKNPVLVRSVQRGFGKSDGERRGRRAQIYEEGCRLQTLEKERKKWHSLEFVLTDGVEEEGAGAAE